MMSSPADFLGRSLPIALMLLLAAVPAQSQTPGRLYSAEAELIRTHAGRFYLWVESSVISNRDFFIEVSLRGKPQFTCPVQGSLAEVVISDSLSDSLLQSLGNLSDADFSVYFDAAGLPPDTVRIGLPATWDGRIPDAYAELSDILGPRSFRFYDTLDEAEIDLALGQIHLLLLPETEVQVRLEQSYSILGSPVWTEWYLLMDLPDDDLLPAALSYCLKGLLADAVTDSLMSVIIAPRHLDQYFPRNPADAGLLFHQMRDSLTRRDCYSEMPGFCPGLAGMIARAVSECGGSLRLVDHQPSASIRLGCLLLTDQPRDSAYSKAVEHVLSEARSAAFSWSDPGIVAKVDAGPESRLRISRLLSANLRMIPLGRSRLMIVARPEVHHIRYKNAAPSLNDFYLVADK